MRMNVDLHLCPLCGRTMIEEPEWPGLWVCPGNRVRLNDSPPYRFECLGSVFTDQAVVVFEAELNRLLSEGN